jgi:hypothetical protein
MVISGGYGGIFGIFKVPGRPWCEKIWTYGIYRGLNGILERLGPNCKLFLKKEGPTTRFQGLEGLWVDL